METFGSHATGIRRCEAVSSADGCSDLFRLPNGQDGERPTSGHAIACQRKANGRDVLVWWEDSAKQRVSRWSSTKSSVAVLTCHNDAGRQFAHQIRIEFSSGLWHGAVAR